MTNQTLMTRRAFLRRSGGLAAGSLLLPYAPPALAALRIAPTPNFLDLLHDEPEVLDAESDTPKVLVSLPGQRSLNLENPHTDERLTIAYAADGQYIPEALATLNHFFRDHHAKVEGNMDPGLYDLLYRLSSTLGYENPLHVISAYRTPATNRQLRRTRRRSGVARHSLHMEGMAVDIQLPGMPLRKVRDTAIELGGGGVGYYRRSQFVHVDTGPIRYW